MSWRSEMERCILPDKQELIETCDLLEAEFAEMARKLRYKKPIRSRMAYGCIMQDISNSIRHIRRLKHWIVYEEDVDGENGGVF